MISRKENEMQINKNVIRTYEDLIVFQRSYQLAMDIFWLSKEFPSDEIYSLTNQIRRSSRSIAVNIAEGWSKRKYENIFLRHLVDSTGSCDETKVWLKFSMDCQYISKERFNTFIDQYKEVGAMLHSLQNRWQTYSKA